MCQLMAGDEDLAIKCGAWVTVCMCTAPLWVVCPVFSNPAALLLLLETIAVIAQTCIRSTFLASLQEGKQQAMVPSRVSYGRSTSGL